MSHSQPNLDLLLAPLGDVGCYYILENMLLRKRGPRHCPELFTGEEWVPFADTFRFDHGADKVSAAEAKKAAEELWK